MQEPDMFKCDKIGFFCDDQQKEKMIWKSVRDPKTGLALSKSHQENSTYMVDPSWAAYVKTIQNPQPTDLYYKYIPGCCRCEKHAMPYFFTDKVDTDPGYPDTKHNFLMLQIHALEASELTVVVELLHGQFYAIFDNFMKDTADVSIHRPSRANYVPGANTRAAFHALLVSSDLANSGIDMPLNLPVEYYRLPTNPINQLDQQREEIKILVGRPSDVLVSDPGYIERYTAHKREVYTGLSLAHQNTTSFATFANVPDPQVLNAGLYSIPNVYSDQFQQLVWWSQGDAPGQSRWNVNQNSPAISGGLNFLGLPYFPYFSNCKGSGINPITLPPSHSRANRSIIDCILTVAVTLIVPRFCLIIVIVTGQYMSISKVFETHPDCSLVPYKNTISISAYPWKGQVIPNGDQCNTTTDPSLFGPLLLGGAGVLPTPSAESTQWLGPYNGALFDCAYEEQIDVQKSVGIRWYEIGPSTPIFRMGQDAFLPSMYEPEFTVSKGLQKTYSSAWGRGTKIQQTATIISYEGESNFPVKFNIPF